MVSPFLLLLLFWLVAVVKSILFWLYLWQLKEYHIPRFIDHFRTAKGKQVLFNKVTMVKAFSLLFLVAMFPIFDGILYLFLMLYCLEVLFIILNTAKRGILRPVPTLKMIVLMATTALLYSIISFFVWRVFGHSMLAFTLAIVIADILSPIIISCVVLAWQPFFVLRRHDILRKAAKKRAEFEHLMVIGVTGSYGKTSTKEFLSTILAKKFKVLETPEHKNSEMGIAQTILQDLKSDHEIFIVEMGSYAKGGIKLLCDMVKPSIGIVTGVNEQHLALFGSLENLLSAEGGGELLAALPKSGTLVVNGDNAHCLDLYKKATIDKKIYTIGHDRIAADIWAEEVAVEKDHVSFIAMGQHREITPITARVLGKQHVQNLLGAISVAKELGMSMEEIAAACKEINPRQSGITIKTVVHGITIIDASYSSNPDGARADLDYLELYPGKKIIIMPSLIELGMESARIHQQIGAHIAKICNKAIITTKDAFEDIQESAEKHGLPKEHVIFSENSKEIFNIITTYCSKEDVVLLEGRVPSQLIKLLTDGK